MPRVRELDLSHNMLSDLCHLEHLSCLTHLDLSINQIHSLEALHTKLGNITTLCLANNKLESLRGMLVATFCILYHYPTDVFIYITVSFCSKISNLAQSRLNGLDDLQR